jgi:quercetin dioxygenase-like cupin family protein
LPVQEIIPGFHGRLVHTERVTLAHWDIAAGSVLPEHHHFHEQITRVMAGTFELTCAGETRQVTAGDIAVIPANEPHSGRALTDCVLIELFQPARDEYRL